MQSPDFKTTSPAGRDDVIWQPESGTKTNTIIVGDKPYMRDAKGALVPEALVKPIDKLMDETVRHMVQHAQDLNAQVSRFKGHCFTDVGSLAALIGQNYGAELGGKKGNITLTSYDGTQKVAIQVADLIEFGPELQAAKTLVDACLTEWSADSNDNLRALVNHAFSVDKEGKINRAELFMLMRYEISDPRWQRAMDAVRDSIRVIGSKTYIRFYQRPRADAAWQAIAIDLAQV
jgi:Protein of unknown function (DUF3164)